MSTKFQPIGFVSTTAQKVPRHWSVSNVEGRLVIYEKFLEGLKDIAGGDLIVVIFHFHESSGFDPGCLTQKPPHRQKKLGVFSTCSPIRPNPIGMSVLEVLERKGCEIHVKGLDMRNGTPILDIKPYIDKPSR